MVAFEIRLLGKWVYVTWFALCCLGVSQGILPTDTATRARCISNCYTMHASYNNDSEKTCQTTACQECLSPCEKWKKTFSNELQCLQTCMNSSNCEASCKFLTQLKNFSSILAGDGSTPPKPSIPTVTNKTLTSISLKWDPVQNTSGTPVYLIAMDIMGDWDPAPHYFIQVFTSTRATIETPRLCALVDSRMRSTYDGLFYKFRLAVLTENSSISYGAETTQISLPQPAPVSNLTIPTFEYDGARSKAKKLKLTASWTPPKQADLVSNYAMVWDQPCPGPVLPKSSTTGSLQTNGFMYIDEDLKKCSQILKVYALSQCIPSSPTTITYEYPGCRNITSYPTDLCYKFDPPESPNEHRTVRNLSYRVVSIDDDYRFNISVIWDPPIYAYKQVESYTVKWLRQHAGFFEFPKVGKSYETSYKIPQLKPKEVYDVYVSPKFRDSTPTGLEKTFSIPTPKVDPAEVQVRKLIVDDFTFSSQTGKFDLNVTWQKPSFNYSQMSSYNISYQVNEGSKVKTNTDKTHFNIHGILHGETVAFNVTPTYLHSWISGNEYRAKSSAPGPDPAQVTVRNLVLNDFTLKPQTGKYSLNVSWRKPSFNYSQIVSYAILYRVNNGDENATQTSKTYFNIYGMSHGQPVVFSVTPQYNNSKIIAVTSQQKTYAPAPPDREISVQHLKPEGDFVEDKLNNTFAANFTWEAPSFPYRRVLYYNLTYELSGYPRDQFPCSSFVRGPRCTITGLRETKYLLSGILPQDHVSIEVTPVYNDKYISGKMQRAEASAPAPREELLKVVGISHDELVPTSDGSFRTKVSWYKPLFKHSTVSYYSYKITNSTQKTVGKFRRRAIDFDTVSTTKNTSVTIDGIQLGEAIQFKVTPVFAVNMVTGRESTISILKSETPSTDVSRSMTPGETAGLVIGLLLLVLIVLCLMIWCHKERQKKLEAKGLVSGKHALMIDHWEVDGDLVCLEEELGEGAFGKVYKGALKGLTTPCQKQSTMKTTRTSTIKGNEMLTVAVKMLHNMADSDQRREFLEEIQLMKAVGSHKNIINMLGCCTVQEPMFLLVEYIPYGDLLHYLRKHRGKVKEYLGDDSRGPYRSTYCETYFKDGSPIRISVRATKNDRVYVNAPEMQKEKNEDIQLLSFNSCKSGDKTREENKGLDTSEDEEELEKREDEEILTPGDLMAFAWQIGQGMEYLAKKGFIHRDLAARNILVGEKKIAKVADFGLTRHVYEEKVYHAKRNRKLPLKWMSIEAIFDQTFTAQSDVWAFGVVLWELVTLGGTPYPSIDNKELLRLLKDGYRMEKPDTCNEELYEMMMDCWRESPEGRPNFTEIRERLEIMMQKDNPYLDLSALDESREYYNVPSFNSVMEESTDDDVFGKENQECRRDSNENVEFVDEKPVSDSNGRKTKSLEPMENGKISIDIATDDGYYKVEDQGPKDVKINFDELQMSLCRPARRGIAF